LDLALFRIQNDRRWYGVRPDLPGE